MFFGGWLGRRIGPRWTTLLGSALSRYNNYDDDGGDDDGGVRKKKNDYTIPSPFSWVYSIADMPLYLNHVHGHD